MTDDEVEKRMYGAVATNDTIEQKKLSEHEKEAPPPKDISKKKSEPSPTISQSSNYSRESPLIASSNPKKESPQKKTAKVE